MGLCPRCGAELDITYPLGLSCWVERCPACGHEGGGTISYVIPEGLDADREVSGFFRLTGLAQYPVLRSLLPSLMSTPSPEIIRKLKEDGLRWWVGPLKIHQARRYQEEAGTRGLEVVILDEATDGANGEL